MKIGVLTYHWVSNFGANLQALSTYQYIKNAGHEPIIINWIPADVEEEYNRNVIDCQNAIHREFARLNFPNITKVCRNGQEIASEIERLSISKVLIGSDAVFTNLPQLARWRLCKKGIVHLKPKSDSDFPNPFWADFVNYLKTPVEVVAISASAQNMPYKKILFSKERKGYLNALKQFGRISVRDIWTQKMIRFVSKNEIIPDITPDPVFGFEENVKPEKLRYVNNVLGIGDNYVLFSAWQTIKDNKWIQHLETLFSDVGIVMVGLPKTTMKEFDSPLKKNLHFPISPLEWYDAIKYSSGYIGELMHPVLVSLHNSVPVYSFDTYGFTKRNRLDVDSSKIYQILSRFNLLDYYYNKKYNKKLPSPEEVFNKITHFDKQECSEKASQMWTEYNSMMLKSI